MAIRLRTRLVYHAKDPPMTRSGSPARGVRGTLVRSLQAGLGRLPTQHLKKVPGIGAAYGALYRVFGPRGEAEVECLGHRLHLRADDQGIARRIVMTGVYEPQESKFFIEWLRPGMTVLDVGANFGYFTVLAARAVGPTGIVHAFEPEPGNFALLVKNIATNGYSVRAHAHRLALSDAPGRGELFTDASNLGNPSLTAKNVPAGNGSTMVELVTLDAFLADLGGGRPRVDLMKMDTQGHEPRVIAGARELIERDRPTLVMEIWPNGVRRAGNDPKAFLDDLVAHGYAIRRLDEKGRLGAAVGVAELLESCDRRRTGEDFENVVFDPR
jgi:FkbM family methyltransferase